ncbi:YwhD family protein [Bacillus marinisedimentorum]|uniref:YwhD family protein n=1 Tax=Bacillus marinisedimentorum TaxID=1821260 RepID=UPI0007DF9A28|nr:YwhD family protein [Bacillus marinisedimentorum]
MSESNGGSKKKPAFNIIKKDSTDGHGGFGAGAFSLDNISPVIVDVEEGSAVIDVGAMHARSQVEKGIKFLPDKADVPNGKPYWLVWVTVERGAEGPYYYGVTACEMTVDRDIRRGYKSLPEHVNRMDKSMKGRIIVDHIDDKSKQILRDFLQGYNEEYWEHSSDELKKALA